MIKYNYTFDEEEDKARDHLVQRDEKVEKGKEKKKSKKSGTDEDKPQTQETN